MYRLSLLIAAVGLLMAPIRALAGSLPSYDPNWSEGRFTAPAGCAGTSCHVPSAEGDSPAIMRAPGPADPSLPDPSGEDVSPGAGNRINLMAHALNDPYFLSVVEDESTLFPGLAGDIEDACTRCHAPMGRSHAHLNDIGLEPQSTVDDPTGCSRSDGCYRVYNPDGHPDVITALEQNVARAGVSCTLCHQVFVDEMDLAAASTAGNGAYQLFAVPQLIGPYSDPAVNFMAGYDAVFDPQIRDAELCGACHNLVTEVVEVESGMPTGSGFLEQGTFFEWRNSDFGGPRGDAGRTDCQACHMAPPDPTYMTRIANRVGLQAREPFATHRLPGGNTHTLEMLSINRGELGLDESLTDAEFQRQIDVTRQFLGSAARLDLSPRILSGAIEVDVTTRNLAGHKIPTGFPSRRMWIHLAVSDRSGATFFESGAADGEGRLEQDSAFTAADCVAMIKPEPFDDVGCFEPHRDFIDDEAQVAIYESVMADTNGDITHILVHGAGYRKDNRLPPAGFFEMGADFVPETASVLGMADADFNAAGSGGDTVTYRIDTAGRLGPFEIRVRLLYQSIRPSFVDAMHTAGARVSDFKAYYATTPPPAEEMASAEISTLGDELVFLDGYEG